MDKKVKKSKYPFKYKREIVYAKQVWKLKIEETSAVDGKIRIIELITNCPQCQGYPDYDCNCKKNK